MTAAQLITRSVMRPLALGIALSVVPLTASAEGTLNVYNWAEYIGEETIANFEKEFGIKVTYDNYDSVETADAKLLAGNSGYDVVSHSGNPGSTTSRTCVMTLWARLPQSGIRITSLLFPTCGVRMA